MYRFFCGLGLCACAMAFVLLVYGLDKLDPEVGNKPAVYIPAIILMLELIVGALAFLAVGLS